MPNGASMKDCIFRAHDERFHEITGDSPEIVRLAKKDYDFAHEVTARPPRAALVTCILLLPLTLPTIRALHMTGLGVSGPAHWFILSHLRFRGLP